MARRNFIVINSLGWGTWAIVPVGIALAKTSLQSMAVLLRFPFSSPAQIAYPGVGGVHVEAFRIKRATNGHAATLTGNSELVQAVSLACTDIPLQRTRKKT